MNQNNMQFMRYLYIKKIEKDGGVDIIIHGDSMSPTIEDGALVKIRRAEEYRLDDIVAFLCPDGTAKIIVHRIVLDETDYVLTKGDNNDFIDPFKVYKKIILGKVE